ncbi:MAG TPA: hypothetical protein VNO30_37590 [Kofleriaceae bacterium]|nr:hypothetical protein [Kofleriaceae bacterium]
MTLGIPGLRPLPALAADPAGWAAVDAALAAKVFLRAEGTAITMGAPQLVEPDLAARLRELTSRFAAFYRRAIATYFERPELAADYLVNPLLAPLIELDRHAPFPDPAHRFDAVLDGSGALRVIENNSVGVCLFHYRAHLYLIRELARRGLEDAARALEVEVAELAAGFRRYYEAAHPAPRERPTIGSLAPREWLRAGQRLFRAAFERHGFDYVHGGPDALEVTASGIRLRGRPIDLLWSDFLFYPAYQADRYLQTKFPSRLGRYDDAPAQVAALVADPRFIGHLAERRVINLSPATAYLGLPKLLLSWIHRADRPVADEDRAYLARFVARTYAAAERAGGVIGRDEAIERREELLIKPCQYGGSHGVVIGRDVAADAWAVRLAEIWEDPTWVVQHFVEPARTADSAWLSLGLSSFGGRLGGVVLRTSPRRTVSARDAAYIPTVLP